MKTETQPQRRMKLTECDIGDYVFISDAEQVPHDLGFIRVRLDKNNAELKLAHGADFQRVRTDDHLVFKRWYRYEPNGERVDIWERIQ